MYISLAATLLLGIFSNTGCANILSITGNAHYLSDGEDKGYKTMPLPQLVVQASHDFLIKAENVHLDCEISTDDPNDNSRELAHLLTDVQWYRNGKLIENSVDHAVASDNSITLHANGRSALTHLEGSYRCVGSVLMTSDDSGSHVRLTSPPLAMHAAYLDKFPSRSYYNQEHGGGANDADWLRINTIQGQLAYVPCLGLPHSIPTPARISFERITHGTDDVPVLYKQPEMISESTDRLWLTPTGLQLALAQPSDSGKYRCHVTNTLTNKTRHQRNWIRLRVDESHAAEVTPAGPVVMPVSKLHYPDERITRRVFTVNSTAVLECISDLGRIEWRKVGADQPLSSNVRSTIKWGSLVIDNLLTSDTGVYECRSMPPMAMGLSSQAHEQRAPSAQYEVIVVDRLTALMDVVADDDGHVTITCRNGGSLGAAGANAFVDLFINGQSVSSTSSPLIGQITMLPAKMTARLSETATGKLSVQCVTPSMANVTRLYDTVLLRGHASSTLLDLTDRPTPPKKVNPPTKTPMSSFLSTQIEILKAPQNVSAAIGDSASMMCIASAGGLNAYWLKEDKPLHIDNRRIRLFGSGTLDIDPVEASDQGWYTCVAQSFNGHKDKAKAFLNVQGTDYYEMAATTRRVPFGMFVPPVLSSSSIATTTTTTTTLATTTTTTTTSRSTVRPAWMNMKLPAPTVHQIDDVIHIGWEHFDPSPAGDLFVTECSISMQKQPDTRWHTVLRRIQTNEHTAIVDRVTPGNSYVFRVEYHLNTGDILYTDVSPSLTVRPAVGIGRTLHLKPPMLLAVLPESRSSLRLTWDQPHTGTINGYLVEYQPRSTKQQFKQVHIPDATLRDFSLRDLLPSSAYTIRLRGVNQFGVSEPSNEMVAWTMASSTSPVPAPPGSSPDDDWTLTRDRKPAESDDKRLTTKISTFLQEHLARADRVLIILGVLFLTFIVTVLCCSICCCVRQRSKHKLNKASHGKYLDASHRIYQEQQTTKSGRAISMYQDAMVTTLDRRDSNGTMSRTTLARQVHQGTITPVMGTINRNRPINAYAESPYGTYKPHEALMPLMSNGGENIKSSGFGEYEIQENGPSVYGYDDEALDGDNMDEFYMHPPVQTSSPNQPSTFMSPYRSGMLVMGSTNEVGTSPLTSHSRSTPDSQTSGIHKHSSFRHNNSDVVYMQQINESKSGTPVTGVLNPSTANTSSGSQASVNTHSHAHSHNQNQMSSQASEAGTPLVLSTFKPSMQSASFINQPQSRMSNSSSQMDANLLLHGGSVNGMNHVNRHDIRSSLNNMSNMSNHNGMSCSSPVPTRLPSPPPEFLKNLEEKPEPPSETTTTTSLVVSGENGNLSD